MMDVGERRERKEFYPRPQLPRPSGDAVAAVFKGAIIRYAIFRFQIPRSRHKRSEYFTCARRRPERCFAITLDNAVGHVAIGFDRAHGGGWMSVQKLLNGDASFADGVIEKPSEKPTILIVDDTPANLTLLAEVLKPDYRTKVAVSGERALKLASSATPPDLILLDIMMPGMDGYEVCKRLKADPATRGIPVVFVTAMNEVEDETKGLELGGVDYLTKPISAAIVKARIRTHLLLDAQAKAMERMIVELETQAAELLNFNRTLEDRVRDGINQVERLGRLKRFFSP